MTRIIIKKLTWNEWDLEHIKKHGVSVDEILLVKDNLIVHKLGYKGRYIATARAGTRIISIVVNREEIGKYALVTARDADKKERKKVYEKEKNRSNP